VGYILGHFFTLSSGHPASNVPFYWKANKKARVHPERLAFYFERNNSQFDWLCCFKDSFNYSLKRMLSLEWKEGKRSQFCQPMFAFTVINSGTARKTFTQIWKTGLSLSLPLSLSLSKTKVICDGKVSTLKCNFPITPANEYDGCRYEQILSLSFTRTFKLSFNLIKISWAIFKRVRWGSALKGNFRRKRIEYQLW
jgi:hypothetical protein